MGADDITQIPPLTDIEWADLEKAFEDFTLDKQAKCECGAEAVGSDRHSDWCKKAWVIVNLK